MIEDDRPFSAKRLALLLGLLLFITFPGIILGSHTFVFRDDGLFGYPVAYYFRQCFWHGRLPLWNPYNNCGIPFLAQWNTIVLYPLSLLYLLGPMPWSMNYFLIGHFFLAGIGMYFLAQRWFGNRFAASVAGLAFAWNGLSINLLIWSCHIAALAWMPWVVLLCEEAAALGGRAIFWAALAGGCQMMTGSPEIILFTWIIALAVSAVKSCGDRSSVVRAGLRLTAVAGLVTALSAAQLLPWIDLVTHGYRSSAFDRGLWALPLWGVGNFLVPLFRDNWSIQGVYWQPGQEMFSHYYAGIITLALALVALLKVRDRRAILLAVLALAALDCAFGNAGYGLPLLKKVVPLFGFARYPVKFLFITLFCLPLLAAAGVTWLQSHAAEARRVLLTAVGITAAGAVAVLIVSRQFPFPGETWGATWRSGWTRLVLLTAFALLWRHGSRHWLFGFGLLFLMGVDICTLAPVQIPAVASQAYDETTPQMTSLPELGRSRAFVLPAADLWREHLANSSGLALYLSHREGLYKNCNLLDLIPKVDGFFSMFLRRQDQVAKLFYRPEYPTNLAEFLGVSQVPSEKSYFAWQARTNFMPVASIGQKPVFLDDDAALPAIASPDFKPREMVYLPPETRELISASADPSARIVASRMAAENCQYETESARPTMLVVAQTWYHCWIAQIDGQSAPLFRANYDFQAVAVPAGRHEIRLIYRDTLFHIGAGVSLFSLAVCLIGARRDRNDSHKTAS